MSPAPRSPTHLSVKFFVDIGRRVQLLQDSNDRLVVGLAHRTVKVAVLSFLQTARGGAGEWRGSVEGGVRGVEGEEQGEWRGRSRGSGGGGVGGVEGEEQGEWRGRSRGSGGGGAGGVEGEEQGEWRGRSKGSGGGGAEEY